MLSFVCLFVAAQAATVAFDAEKNRPVTKVINLLKDMQQQLAREGEEDEAVFEKITCWCQTNDKDKTTSISDAESRITDLTATIEEDTAIASRLTTEIKNLEQEISKNQAALAKANALRQKELAEFNAEEKDMLQSIGALKSAVTVLGKHNSFVQVPSETIINMAAMMEKQFHEHADLIAMIATPTQKKAIAAFVQSPSDYFDGSLIQANGTYAPQSGAIFGILEQMKETFETNLASSQKEELQGQETFAAVKSAKETEIEAGTEQHDKKVQELADTGAHLAQCKQDSEDTAASMSADQVFLANLKETCQSTDQEWEERSNTRHEEIQACGEALAILSSDDAHDTFTSTFNFVQVEEVDRRNQASNILAAASKKFMNPKLAALASHTKLDTFAKLAEDIDGMIVGLQKEKADDIKQKDFCIKEMNENERAIEMKTRDMEESDAQIQQLQSNIAELTAAIDQLNAEVAEMQVQLKRAGEDRELENSDFQKTVADQRGTQKLLTNALNVLKGFYDKKSLIQTSDPAGPPPPAGFKKYEKQGGAGGVTGMLTQIIFEAKQMEADAIKAEADSQKAYESFVKDTNKSLEEKARDLTNKKATKSEAEEDLIATEQKKDAQSAEQQSNMNEKADLHAGCDFTLNNFDTRQSALEQEMESLRQAKAVLSGSSMKAFLQKH